MNLLAWSLIITLIVAVPVIAGRPPMQWSDHRRALRTIRRMNQEERKAR